MNRKGFTLVELLVVLLIVGILAAVATPLYLSNANRARASEAIATMSLVRQGLRDYRINNNRYFDIVANGTTGNIQNPIPDGSINLDGTCTGCTVSPGVNLDVGIPQYYSNSAFTVASGNSAATLPTDTQYANPAVVDFLITADGSTSQQCVGGGSPITANCAINANDVNDIDVKMDNSGRIYVTFNATAGTPIWQPY